MDENKKIDEQCAALEALLFIYGEPLSYKRIEKILAVNTERRSALIEALQKKYEEQGSGLQLVFHGETAQLVTQPKFSAVAHAIMQEEVQAQLTPAALEALTLIAYGGPLSRAQIDYMRGVNSSFILRSLLIRGLIERAPDPQHPNTFLYHLGIELLKKLGLQRQEDLLEYAKYQKLIEQFLHSPSDHHEPFPSEK